MHVRTIFSYILWQVGLSAHFFLHTQGEADQNRMQYWSGILKSFPQGQHNTTANYPVRFRFWSLNTQSTAEQKAVVCSYYRLWKTGKGGKQGKKEKWPVTSAQVQSQESAQGLWDPDGCLHSNPILLQSHPLTTDCEECHSSDSCWLGEALI